VRGVFAAYADRIDQSRVPFTLPVRMPAMLTPRLFVIIKRIVAVLLVVFFLSIATPATAQQGNSWTAHACQDGGYLDFERFDGSPFRNAGECVSYAARHGALYTAPTLALIVVRDGPSTTIGVVATGLAAGSQLEVEGFDPVDGSRDLANLFAVPESGEVNLPAFTTITCDPGFEWDLIATGTTRHGTTITDTADFACGLGG
jgi:hypothetical protein